MLSPVLTCWPSFRLRRTEITGLVPSSATISEIALDKRMVFTDQPLPVAARSSALPSGCLTAASAQGTPNRTPDGLGSRRQSDFPAPSGLWAGRSRAGAAVDRAGGTLTPKVR